MDNIKAIYINFTLIGVKDVSQDLLSRGEGKGEGGKEKGRGEGEGGGVKGKG